MGNLLARSERENYCAQIFVNKFQLYNLAPTQRIYDVG